MPASAATPMNALTLLRVGIACSRPAKVAGTAEVALGEMATALSMNGWCNRGEGPPGQRHYSKRPPSGMGETGPQCGVSSRQRAACRCLRWRPLERSAMNVTLKPFDFAQAVARAGLGTDGMPLANAGAVAETGFQKVLGQALGAVSKSQNDAASMQRELTLD